jgi:DNA-binding MarR family transcriptional regulator
LQKNKIILSLNISIFPSIGFTAKMYACYINKTFKKHNIDINNEQFIILKALTNNSGKPQHDLAAITESDKTSLSRLISTMEKKGFISRKSIKEDKRVKSIYLTNLGESTYLTALPILNKTTEKLLKGIEASEISQTIETINKIQQNITKEYSFKL